MTKRKISITISPFTDAWLEHRARQLGYFNTKGKPNKSKVVERLVRMQRSELEIIVSEMREVAKRLAYLQSQRENIEELTKSELEQPEMSFAKNL